MSITECRSRFQVHAEQTLTRAYAACRMGHGSNDPKIGLGDGITRGDAHVSRALVLPIALSAIAGFVDAVGFLHLFGVFSANQSGNIILFGIALTGASPSPAWALATAIVAFMFGTAIGVLMTARMQPVRRAPLLLAVECALLATVAVLVIGPIGDQRPLSSFWQAVLLSMTGVAMGVQTEVIRRVAGIAIATTYQTGAIAHIGEATATLVDAKERRAGLRLICAISAVLAGYIIGAALGACPLGEGRAGVILPCVAIAVLLMLTMASPALLLPDLSRAVSQKR